MVAFTPIKTVIGISIGRLLSLSIDHLGSTSLVVSTSGTIVAQNRYMPWGEVRYSSGTMPTDYTYTGQKNAATS